MPPTTAPALPRAQPLTVGSILSGAMSSWANGIVTYTILSLLFHAPLFLLANAMLPDVMSFEGIEKTQNWAKVQMFLGGALEVLLAAAIAYGAVQRLRGQPAGVGSCAGAALSRFLPLIGLALLMGLIALAIIIPLVLLMIPIVMGGGLRAAPTMTVVVAMAVLGIVVVSMVMTRYFVASPGIAVERLGVTLSMKESVRLTAGSRLRIFGFIVLVGIVDYAITFVLGRGIDSPRTEAYASLTIEALLLKPFRACAAAVVYQNLRMAKDGVDLRTLASVFE